MKKTFFDFLRDQWSTVPPVEHADLSGRTVIVVGANSGVGFETAKHFATMNPGRLILACRNAVKANAAMAAIASKTGYKGCEVWLVDLADFSSVMAFADRFEKDGGRLDILVLNAVVLQLGYEATVDGWETSLQVNHLSHALLSFRLTPHLIQTGISFSTTSRMIIVSSDIHFLAKIPEEAQNTPHILKTMNGKDFFREHRRHRHGETKLMTVFHTRTLNDRLQAITPLIVTAVNPGCCSSRIRQCIYDRGTFSQKLRSYIMETLLAWSSEKGARQVIYAAVLGSDKKNAHLQEKLRGGYVSLAQVVEVSDGVLSKEGKKCQERIWDETVAILAAVSPKVREIVDGYLTPP